MEKKELLSILDNQDSQSCDFLKFCDKVKGLIFSYLNQEYEVEQLLSTIDNYGVLQYNLSPIEQIFYIAFYLYCLRFYKLNDVRDFSMEFGIPVHSMFMEEITPQKRVVCSNKKYVVDFVIDFSRTNLKGELIYPKLGKLKYAIELDGFDYHSKKDQMNNDYARENDLKLAGYNVIRFTGSQIFNNPYTCVDTVISLIMKDIELCLLEV